MSLLDDVSIVVTPNGYKAGELYAVVPVPVEGSEEVTNVDFATDSDWTLSSGLTFSAGAILFDDENDNLFQGWTNTVNTLYKLTITKTGSGTLRFRSGFAGTDGVRIDIPESGIIYFTSTSDTNRIQIYGDISDVSATLNSVSVKEYTAADMDVTRATAATRVDEAGLVNYAEIIGSDLVTNGDFATDTDWTKGTGWSISGGKASNDGSQSGNSWLRQNSVLVVGKRYKASFNLIVSSGQIIIDSQSGATTYSSSGLITDNFVATTTTFQFMVNNSFIGSIDNVSVKEATRDNVPRIDYTGGGCPHILAEPQRTNNIKYSEDFSQSDWRKDKVTVTADSIISPSGELNASLIQETVYTGGIPSFDLLDSITLAAGSHTFSFYVKNNSGRYLGISFGSSAQRVRTNFDFNTNTFKTLLLSGTTTGSASFTTLGDFYRITITATFPSSTAADTVLMPLATDTYPFFAFQDSDNRSFHLWGAQLEEDSYATSYIPTSGSTVTRNQDQFSRDGIGSLINSEEGTLVIEPRYFINDGSGTGRKIAISDGTSTNRIYITPYQGLASRIRYIFTNGGATQADLQVTGIDITISRKLAFVWKANRFELWQNGSKISEDTSGTTPSAGTFNEINLSSELGNGAEPFEGELKQLQVYKTALTDAQLNSLTS